MKVGDWVPMLARLPVWVQVCWVVWVFFGVFLFVWSANALAQKKPQGKILNPLTDQVVTRSFEVNGTVAHLPRGHTLWLAVQIGDLVWPKEPKISQSDTEKWIASISEGGTPAEGRFSLVLIAADGSATVKLDEWFRQGRRGGHAGIPINALDDGMKILDSVQLRLR